MAAGRAAVVHGHKIPPEGAEMAYRDLENAAPAGIESRTHTMNQRAAQAFIEKLRQLPPERIDEVSGYVDFLIARHRDGGRTTAPPTSADVPFETLSGSLMEQIDSEMQVSRSAVASAPR